MCMNIYIETYGCSSNQCDSEILSGLLQKAGCDIVKKIDNADLIIVNTCFVKQVTEQKIIFRLKDLQMSYPEKKLIISGCMPEGAYRRLVDIAPDASLVSTHQITKIVQAVQKTLEGRRVEYLGKSEEVKLCLPRIRKNSIIGIVPISYGCNSLCTYCCVRLAKGKLFSFPKEMIVEEIGSALKEGCKEMWVTAQDTASYGFDKGEKLPQLLREISKISGKFFVRVGMMNVKNVIPIASDLIEAFNDKKIYKFVHLPLQSGSDKVLSDMNRGYTASNFEELANLFGSLRCQVWTDIIVGYPTEEEKDFLKTLEILKKIKPDWVNISKFGPRPGTEAAKLKPLVSKVVNERSRIASELVRRISLEKNKEWIGWEGNILVSEKGKKHNQWIGRNLAYKPVLVESNSNPFGKFLRVRIIETSHSYLIGKPL